MGRCGASSSLTASKQRAGFNLSKIKNNNQRKVITKQKTLRDAEFERLTRRHGESERYHEETSVQRETSREDMRGGRQDGLVRRGGEGRGGKGRKVEDGMFGKEITGKEGGEWTLPIREGRVTMTLFRKIPIIHHDYSNIKPTEITQTKPIKPTTHTLLTTPRLPHSDNCDDVSIVSNIVDTDRDAHHHAGGYLCHPCPLLDLDQEQDGGVSS